MSEKFSMGRRELLAGATAVAAMASSKIAFAEMDHQHHHVSNPYEPAIDAALGCLKDGQACLDHCMILFKKGDNSVADCADTVNEMLAMCSTLSKLASYQSRHLKAFAKVCIASCKDCRKECRKHEDKHAECKACADSCKKCIEQCEKLIA
ncbi:MAG: four-helix bundle copper-binding protein [Gammaproteobacteria bacterium]|nr:four-helix bundle copper-binding protein [Gammaproteobacteria bacterium]